jgi:SAM-dependent methyltransferase
LAEAGHDVTGLDLSQTMLWLARAKVQALPSRTRERIRLVRGDMASFDLRRTFGLVAIPDNSFRELPTRGLMLRCLRTVRRHLRGHGRLLITERRHRPEIYPDGVRTFGWSAPMRDPGTGGSVRRRGYVRLHRDGRRLSGAFEYEVTLKGGRRLVRCPWSAPLLALDEYVSLFSRAGFRTQVSSDYAIVKDRREGDLWCFVCSPC